MNRACDDQPHLTRTWVRKQSRKGWHLLPLSVGRQASCAPKGLYRGQRISDRKAGDYAKARRQGRQAAQTAAGAARRLGIARRSVLWFDLEHFDTSRTRCRRSALAFVSGWTSGLHHRHFRSGLYSSASSGISVLDRARSGKRSDGRRRLLPDYVWIAEWNNDQTVRSAYIDTDGWWPHRRVHQYRGGHDERHGGARINVDSNFLRTGRGTVAGKDGTDCGVRVGFDRYSRLQRKDRGAKVRAAQCLLRRGGAYDGRLHGRYDRSTTRAVVRFQRRHDPLPTTGRIGARTWTGLLSRGATPLLKWGSGGDGVRRLQRALNAAGRAGLTADGVFGRAEETAVKLYQRRTGRDRTGVVDDGTWRLLQRGRAVGRLEVGRSLADRLDLVRPLGLTRGAGEHGIGAE